MRYVLSLKGKDKGKIFLAIKCDTEYVYIVDGKRRRVEKPKRKKHKHVKILQMSAQTSFAENTVFSNKLVRKLIKEATECFCEKQQ